MEEVLSYEIEVIISKYKEYNKVVKNKDSISISNFFQKYFYFNNYYTEAVNQIEDTLYELPSSINTIQPSHQKIFLLNIILLFLSNSNDKCKYLNTILEDDHNSIIYLSIIITRILIRLYVYFYYFPNYLNKNKIIIDDIEEFILIDEEEITIDRSFTYWLIKNPINEEKYCSLLQIYFNIKETSIPKILVSLDNGEKIDETILEKVNLNHMKISNDLTSSKNELFQYIDKILHD